MNRFYQTLRRFPGVMCKRMAAALLLMAAFPVLGAMLVICDRFGQRVYGLTTECLLLALCLLLSWLGFWQIRFIMLNMIDIRHYAEEIIRLRKKAQKEGGEMEQVVRMEHLLIYLQGQMEAAHEIIRGQFTEQQRGPAHVHLPPLVPRPMLVPWLGNELRLAEKAGVNLGIVLCESGEVSPAERGGDTSVPPWLRMLLADTTCPFRFLGCDRAGRWIGVVDCADDHEVRTHTDRVKRWGAEPERRDVTVHVWNHPVETFTLDLVGGGVRP